MIDTGFGAPQGAAKQAHRPYRYLVALGYEQIDVHCPACLGVSDGWYDDTGEPRYRGGWLTLRHTKTAEEWTFRCRCWMGRTLGETHKKLAIRTIPNHPMPEWINPHPLGWVLWDRNRQTERPYGTPEAPTQAQIREMAPRVAQQIQRALRGDLDARGLSENLRVIAERVGLPPAPASPTLNDVLNSTALSNLYWPGS